VFKGTVEGDSRTGFGRQAENKTGFIYTGEYHSN
jgi:hypothetical protein